MKILPLLQAVLSREKWMFLLLFTPFLYISIIFLVNGVPDFPNSGDAALLELNTRNVFSRGILLGPYSRFPFFHPGPLYFQLRYPIYTIFGCRNSSFLFVTVVIQALSLFLCWKIAREVGNGSLALFFAASAAMYLLSTDKSIWLSEWNPYIVILPFMLYTVSMAAFASGLLKYIPLAIVSGSLAAQTHISVIPSMMVIGAFAVLCFIYPWTVSSRKSSSFVWKPVLIGAGLLLLLWAAPLYQQLFPGDGQGNMTSIVDFFRETPPDVNSQRASAMWSSSLTGLELGSFDSSASTENLLIAIRLLLLLACFIYLRKRGDRPFLAASALICIILHGTSLMSVMQIRGELNGYLVQWSGIIPPLAAFVFLGTIAQLLKPSGVIVLKALAALFLVFAAVVLPFRTSDFYRSELHPSWEREIAVRELAEQLRLNLDWTGNDFYVITLVSTEQWPVMFGLLNSFEKLDLPVGIEDNFLYIPVPVPEGMRARTLYLGTLNEQGLVMPGLSANWNGTGLILE